MCRHQNHNAFGVVKLQNSTFIAAWRQLTWKGLTDPGVDHEELAGQALCGSGDLHRPALKHGRGGVDADGTSMCAHKVDGFLEKNRVLPPRGHVMKHNEAQRGTSKHNEA